jgi:hypothetical protein
MTLFPTAFRSERMLAYGIARLRASKHEHVNVFGISFQSAPPCDFSLLSAIPLPYAATLTHWK